MLFLTSPECGIPKTQPMDFAQARDAEYPPYLLNFAGTPGERHVENLKVTSSFTDDDDVLIGRFFVAHDTLGEEEERV